MTRPITIFGSALSPFSVRVIMACKFKGLPYELMMPKDGMKSPAYLKIHPFGKIPAIKDGSFTLYESGVIVEYLEAKYKKRKLIPRNIKTASRARLIAAVSSEYVQTGGLKLFRLKRANSGTSSEIEPIMGEISKGLDVLEPLLSGKKFAAGSSFTIADCYAVPALFLPVTMAIMFEQPNPVLARKKLKKYWTSVGKDRLCKDVIRGMEERLKVLLAQPS